MQRLAFSSLYLKVPACDQVTRQYSSHQTHTPLGFEKPESDFIKLLKKEPISAIAQVLIPYKFCFYLAATVYQNGQDHAYVGNQG